MHKKTTASTKTTNHGAGQDSDQIAAPTMSAEEMKIKEIKAQMDQIELELVKNGGVNCGWDAADHKDFLRIRTQHNSKTGTVAFNTAMSRSVPLVDEVQVQEHCSAYEKYIMLTKHKKELLSEYKQAKEQERISRMTKVRGVSKNLHALNKDLALDSRSSVKRNNSSAGSSSRVSDMSL